MLEVTKYTSIIHHIYAISHFELFAGKMLTNFMNPKLL